MQLAIPESTLQGEQRIHYELLRKRLEALEVRVKHFKYLLKNGDLMSEEAASRFSELFREYKHYVQNELPHGTEKTFYAPEVSLSGVLDAAQADWTEIQNRLDNLTISESTASFHVKVIASSVMRVFSGKTTEYNLDGY